MHRSAPSSWTERNQLLPAETAYLCSLDARFDASSAARVARLWTFRGGGPEKAPIGRMAHLWQASNVDFQGALRVPPSGSASFGTCELNAAVAYDKMAVRGDFMVDLDGASGILRILYEGVFPVRGGTKEPMSLRDVIPATIFVSATQECLTPAFRWLTRAQLFGVGRLSLGLEKEGPEVLALALDFHCDGRQQRI